MFIVLLTFGEHKDLASTYMDGHKQWLKQGFDEGVFLVSGSLQTKQGGCVMAHNLSLAALQARLEQDPFVQHKVVNTEIIELSPALADERLQFLLN